MTIYIYIYRERERERGDFTALFMHSRCVRKFTSTVSFQLRKHGVLAASLEHVTKVVCVLWLLATAESCV